MTERKKKRKRRSSVWLFTFGYIIVFRGKRDVMGEADSRFGRFQGLHLCPCLQRFLMWDLIIDNVVMSVVV